MVLVCFGPVRSSMGVNLAGHSQEWDIFPRFALGLGDRPNGCRLSKPMTNNVKVNMLLIREVIT